MRFFRNTGGAPEPPPSPENALRDSGRWLAFVAAVNLVSGVLAVVAQWDYVIAQGAGAISLVSGLVYGVLAALALRGVRYAAFAGAIIFVLESLANLAGLAGGGGANSLWLLSRFFIAYSLVQSARGAYTKPV